MLATTVGRAFRIAFFSMCLLSVSAVTVQAQQRLFDDFHYDSVNQLSSNGWQVRTWQGGPGLSNGQWSTDNVRFVTDAQGETSMRLLARTNIGGTNIQNNQALSGQSVQAEVARSEQEYKNGTWAARMYFNDAPSAGPDGDTVIQTFFGLTDYIELTEPYSEIDFEYLPNGGWWTGSEEPAMWSGTYRIVDWSDPANHGVTKTVGSLQGWHTLVMNVTDGHISFYIDGEFQTEFSGDVAPDYPMYLMFQIWFSNDCFDSACQRRGYLNSQQSREYWEDVDWVYFEKDAQLSTADVEQTVQCFRNNDTAFVDTDSTTPGDCSVPDSDDGGDDSGENPSTGDVCNWWGTQYPICTQLDTGWGWQNNGDCVGRLTCEALPDPYGVVPRETPEAYRLHFEAEQYQSMSGIQLEPTVDTDGGQNVGWVDTGDWMAYPTVDIPEAGTYQLALRVASTAGGTLVLDRDAGASMLATVEIPATGGWQTWQTVTTTVELEQGPLTLGVYAAQGGWNLNWFELTR